MVGSVNRVTLIGAMGADPEIRTTQSGDKIANIRLATSETWKVNGERKERTTWHQVVCFNPHLTEVIEKYTRKGSRIYVEGQIQTRDYEKDGVKRYVTEIVMTKFKGELVLLDKPERSDSYEGPAKGGGGSDSFTGGLEDDGDAIPFISRGVW